MDKELNNKLEQAALLVEEVMKYLPSDDAQIHSRSPKEMRDFLMQQLADKIRELKEK